MTVDAAGNVYLAGGDFIAKFQNNGTLIWSQSLAGNIQPTSIAVSLAGKVDVIGLYVGPLNADNDSDAELDSGDANLICSG